MECGTGDVMGSELYSNESHESPLDMSAATLVKKPAFTKAERKTILAFLLQSKLKRDEREKELRAQGKVSARRRKKHAPSFRGKVECDYKRGFVCLECNYSQRSLERFLRHMNREIHFNSVFLCAHRKGPDGKLLPRSQCSVICTLRQLLREMAERMRQKRHLQKEQQKEVVELLKQQQLQQQKVTEHQMPLQTEQQGMADSPLQQLKEPKTTECLLRAEELPEMVERLVQQELEATIQSGQQEHLIQKQSQHQRLAARMVQQGILQEYELQQTVLSQQQRNGKGKAMLTVTNDAKNVITNNNCGTASADRETLDLIAPSGTGGILSKSVSISGQYNNHVRVEYGSK
jgi:predicted transcriptional regulator YheO